ncbi:MAG: hypothetical protein IH800_03460 [Myxococcales bacterium]|nr:hypothetical protein [Myxococcales bacterium]
MAELDRPLSISELSGPALLRLGRKDRAAARQSLRAMSAEAQARACRELSPEVRSEFLLLLEHPEQVVPLLPETEVCITIRASGMSEASWLLELATTEQLRACFDLDCWRGDELDLKRLQEWIEALIEAGREPLLRAVREVDLELWVLLLRALSEVAVLGKDDIPPDGWLTLDGVVYFGARGDAEFALVRELAGATFAGAQAHYWQLVYGALFESPAECEEYALRWRSARLNDLGFPEREQAMQVYRPLQAKEAEIWEEVDARDAVVPASEFPERVQGSLLGETLARLAPDRAGDVLGYVLGVANAVAVADKLPLSDAESVPKALDKAVRGVERGLRELAAVRAQPLHEVLDRTRPLDLFRIGATLDRTLRKR